jgi:hypothetical protein
MRATDTSNNSFALALNAFVPDRAIIEIVLRPGGTIRAWIAGKRRPPLPTLEMLQTQLRQRARELWNLVDQEIEYELWRWRREPTELPSGFLANGTRWCGARP